MPRKRANTSARFSFEDAARIATNVALTLLALGLLAGWVFGRGPLERRIAEQSPAPLSLRINWPGLAGGGEGTWLPESAQQAVTSAALGAASPDVFDRDSLDRAREALLATGWFTEVRSVRRLRGNVVDVRAEWRLPAAVVRWDGRDHLVSTGGEVLPLSYAAGGAGPAMPVVEGAQFGPPTRENRRDTAWGQPWPGGEVQAALALLRTLRQAFGETRLWPQFAGVDVSAFPRTGRLSIITDLGSRVVWGAPPGSLRPGEQTVQQRLERLARLASATGRIDADERLVEIHSAHVFIDQTTPAPGEPGANAGPTPAPREPRLNGD